MHSVPKNTSYFSEAYGCLLELETSNKNHIALGHYGIAQLWGLTPYPYLFIEGLPLPPRRFLFPWVNSSWFFPTANLIPPTQPNNKPPKPQSKPTPKPKVTQAMLKGKRKASPRLTPKQNKKKNTDLPRNQQTLGRFLERQEKEDQEEDESRTKTFKPIDVDHNVAETTSKNLDKPPPTMQPDDMKTAAVKSKVKELSKLFCNPRDSKPPPPPKLHTLQGPSLLKRRRPSGNDTGERTSAV